MGTKDKGNGREMEGTGNFRFRNLKRRRMSTSLLNPEINNGVNWKGTWLTLKHLPIPLWNGNETTGEISWRIHWKSLYMVLSPPDSLPPSWKKTENSIPPQKWNRFSGMRNLDTMRAGVMYWKRRNKWKLMYWILVFLACFPHLSENIGRQAFTFEVRDW